MHYLNDITYGFVLDALNVIAGLDLNNFYLISSLEIILL